MNKLLSMVASVTLAAVTTTAHAALTEEELAKLGTTLTPWGAEIAGNEDGSYPAYEGTIKTPADFDKTTGLWPDAYPEDKPLFSIDASNMEEYKDKLMASQMELMRRHPTFRMDIYPTRRGVWMPDSAIQATQKNARNPECKTSSDGVGLYGCWGGTPFPIPKNGYEVMWNHLATPRSACEAVSANYLVNTSGDTTMLVKTNVYIEYPYHESAQKPYSSAGKYYQRLINYTMAPARDVGQQTMLWYPLNFDKDNQRSWSYTPGQRRVRLAPEFAYDTPSAQLGGTVYYDELSMFFGRMDRFDFKLIGKEYKYMPYNQYRYKLTRDPAKALGPNHINPEVTRWELRRVWVVEATKIPGKRHVASKKRFYVDEDAWYILAYEAWDQADKLFRVNFANSATNYSAGGILDWAGATTNYDLSKNQYSTIQTQLIDGAYFKTGIPRRSDSELAPARLGSRGIR